jgi:hypothetical protein
MNIAEPFARVIVEMMDVCYSEGQGVGDRNAEALLMTWIRSNYPNLMEEFSHLPWDNWATKEGSTIECHFEGCTKPSEVLACGRELFGPGNAGHPIPARYCKEHADIVTDERSPEYTDTCPNCGCIFGVN